MQQRWSRISAFILVLILAPMSWAAEPVKTTSNDGLGRLKANYDALFEKESTAVVFTFFPVQTPASKPPIYVVETVDAQGRRQTTLGELGDDGLIGDVKAGDGIYGRKFQMDEKKHKTLYLRVVDEAVIPSVVVSNTIQIQVLPHPVLQDLLRTVWKRIQEHFHGTKSG